MTSAPRLLLVVLAALVVCKAAVAYAQSAPAAGASASGRVQHYTEIAKDMNFDAADTLISADGSTVAMSRSSEEVDVWSEGHGLRSVQGTIFKSNFGIYLRGTLPDGRVVLETPDGHVWRNFNSASKKRGFTEASAAHAYIWSPADGPKELGKVPGWGRVQQVSADGSVLAGWKLQHDFSGNLSVRLFSWSPGGDVHEWGEGDWVSAKATAISADGSVLLGYYTPDGSSQEKWVLGSRSGGLKKLANDFKPFALTPDGKAIYGTRGPQLVRWTESGGERQLADLGTQDVEISRATNNGVVIGLIQDLQGNKHAFQWTQAGGLEVIPGFEERTVALLSASDDGQIIAATVIGLDGAVHHVVTPINELQARASVQRQKIEAQRQAQAQAMGQAQARAQAEAEVRAQALIQAQERARAEGEKREALLQARIDKVVRGGIHRRFTR